MDNAPATTYRVQLNKDFTLLDLEQLIPYLRRLGIGAIYASPIFQAVPNSAHGYDQTDPLQINPEIGTLEQLKTVAKKLAEAGIGWIQDIVPNHMAFHPENTWLWDVLEKGPDSQFSHFFDTPIASPHYFKGRLMLPFLDAPLDEVLVAGRLKVQEAEGKLVLEYNGQQWPINEAGSTLIGRQPLTEALIREVLACQYYEPCHWQETERRINYRRFFTVNGLIAVNVQDYRVFQATHRTIAKLIKEGIFTGLRIDHVDGLADPTGYLLRLRQLVGGDTYMVVEKILQQGEALPGHWPIQGATGYEFLAMVNGLLTTGSNERRMSRFYDKLVGRAAPPLLLREAKRAQLYHAMKGELNNLFHFLRDRIVDADGLPENLDDVALKAAVASFVVHCPVYRWYGRTFPLAESEATEVRHTLQQAALSEPGLREALSFLENLLVPTFLTGSKRQAKDLTVFYQRCMQLTGVLMAKGLEDTLMYTYLRYIGANEVGGTPAMFNVPVADFHRFMRQRAAQHPHALNATATHDTKRGEDVRARLQTITAFPRTWMKAVKAWMKLNAPYKTGGMPDVNDEYFIYQALWGTFPMPGQPMKEYRARLEEYLVKALREAKRHTDWTNPDQTYEAATRGFIHRMLRTDTPFFHQFSALHAELVDVAIVNSLTQVVLKFTCPGVPDVYQGCEGWDLSFVDPDNRRPVDFGMRRKWQQKLDRLKRRGADAVGEWWRARYSGLLKYGITERLAKLWLSHKALFQIGDYAPIAIAGRRRNHVLSFLRRQGNAWLLVVVPIHLRQAMMDGSGGARQIDWANTRIQLPEGAPTQWHNAITDEVSEASGTLPLADALQRLPVGVWMASEAPRENKRAAGVLLPLFSLPGPYGVGDLGTGAYRFADFLRGARQRYWLMLPHNPTDKGVAHSPYSTHSAMAGNTLWLSLDEFQRQGWITESELAANHLPATARVDYGKARALKHFFFGKAFRNYLQQWDGKEEPAFGDFCIREASWLDDYADYVTLRELHQGKPWYAWPLAYRHRDERAMAVFRSKHAHALQQVKWLQYQFQVQWQRLKAYCHQAGIKLIGDLPFYINHDAADVWAHPELFSLDGRGRTVGMAGVPPDYFNAEGQAWGMPVYRWENHAAQGYSWWIDRIRKNLELYDLLRLDHFRAFHDYWEIPKGAESAKQGSWHVGPGVALFKAVEEAIGGLPFIAEDLGDIHEGVYQLRDELGLPGMKVLQFAFGNDVGANLHAPHHHAASDVVFTGTHDNNTAAGWYRDELSAQGKVQLKAYIGAGRLNPQQASLALCRMAYASPAGLAIVPMQDLLKLGSEARMNVPAAPQANWQWRLEAGQLTPRLQRQLRKWVQLYGR
ncbi:malto-oligosyltrehalose synthase [Parapedobacter koreensis]|uniref:4-alpha-glucanotransferase n=1 Tax=Parapedobacter koreensis TaxID=332977 RepID=A0A1H7T2V4_9SPHI|nr:malto-oligosyltrehalose synthase [Parapedobacter koreensis]SEL78584.1 4-alpha-glucanotransferase/malto-oligosyltrehalose synthase,TIGR02401 [Parapedobacter koreensis]